MDIIDKWIKCVEHYYRDTYNPVQRKKVVKILPRQKNVLQVLYDYLIDTHSNQFKQAPGVKEIKAELLSVYERNPQLRPEHLPRPDVPLLEEGEHVDGQEVLSALSECLAKGCDPRKDERIINIIERAGYTIEQKQAD